MKKIVHQRMMDCFGSTVKTVLALHERSVDHQSYSSQGGDINVWTKLTIHSKVVLCWFGLETEISEVIPLKSENLTLLVEAVETFISLCSLCSDTISQDVLCFNKEGEGEKSLLTHITSLLLTLKTANMCERTWITAQDRCSTDGRGSASMYHRWRAL